jgi:small conductance mechanosensitive channel
MLEVLSYIDYQNFLNLIIEYGIKLIISIFIYFIGIFIINKLKHGITIITSKQKIDKTLKLFILSFINIVLRILLILSIIGYLGIQVTSFIAILGAASLAIGMALSGTLQNFAGGVMLLLFKPYKVDDYITIDNFSGTVSSIQIFNTILLSPDNKTLIIPNSKCSSSSIINYSTQYKRRVDFIFSISYNSSIDKAKEIIKKEFNKNKKLLKAEELVVIISNLGESSVDITVKSWTKTDDYWDFYFEMLEIIKKEFDKNNIIFPFPQREIKIISK